LHATCICVLTTGVEVCGQCAMRQVGLRPKKHSVLCSESRTTKTLPSLFHSDLDPLACYPSVLYIRPDPSRAHLPSSIRACLRHACQKSSLDEVQSYQPLLNSRRPLLNTIYIRDKPLRWHLSSCANTKFVPLFGYRLKFKSKRRAHVYVQRRCSLASLPSVQDSSKFHEGSIADQLSTARRCWRRWCRKVVYHYTAYPEPFRRRVRPYN
jgi:hypothetical protein